jgi:hypothetical protein
MAYMCSSYSSLSVFALHPLYLRVQALSDAIPGDIKVYRCTPFILTLIWLVCFGFSFHPFPQFWITWPSTQFCFAGRNFKCKEAAGQKGKCTFKCIKYHLLIYYYCKCTILSIFCRWARCTSYPCCYLNQIIYYIWTSSKVWFGYAVHFVLGALFLLQI